MRLSPKSFAATPIVLKGRGGDRLHPGHHPEFRTESRLAVAESDFAHVTLTEALVEYDEPADHITNGRADCFSFTPNDSLPHRRADDDAVALPTSLPRIARAHHPPTVSPSLSPTWSPSPSPAVRRIFLQRLTASGVQEVRLYVRLRGSSVLVR